MSSRNAYLTPDERRAATALFRGLQRVSAAVDDGERSASAIRELLVATIATEPELTLEYAEVVDGASLEPVSRVAGAVLVALAVHVGRARLIDNVTITISESGTSDCDGVTVDLGRQAPCDAP
jgi:pantoate--beta-alanine ligase